jgi:hypothetical protein
MLNNLIVELVDRNCDCCGKNNFETLWKYQYNTRSRNSNWVFNINNVICRECGFVFVSPVYKQATLLEYYEDSFFKFSELKLDYDVNKRLNIINEVINNSKDVYLEIGANAKSKFHEELETIYNKVITIEPNNGKDSDYNELGQLNLKADCIAHYFVLEHVADIKGFLSFSFEHLNDDGYMICEVPSLKKYKDFISPLILFEHVNHFTMESLRSIAKLYGFEEYYRSDTMCSRDFGFVMVFRKSNVKRDEEINQPNYYSVNKHYFEDGLKRKVEFENTLSFIQNNILNNSAQNVLIWAANESSKRLLEGYNVMANILIVDIDPIKHNYFDSKYNVFTPAQIEDKIRLFDTLVICTELYSEDILNIIKIRYNKSFEPSRIFIADKI